MGGGKGGSSTPAPDYSAQIAAQEAENERLRQEMEASKVAAEKKRVAEGQASRDSLYTAYDDAWSRSGAAAQDKDKREASAAQLRGIDYTAGQSDRLNLWQKDYMSGVWNAQNQADLTQLFDEFGTSEGYQDYLADYVPTAAGPETGQPADDGTPSTAGGSSVFTDPTILNDEEDSLGANLNLLGV